MRKQSAFSVVFPVQKTSHRTLTETQQESMQFVAACLFHLSVNLRLDF